MPAAQSGRPLLETAPESFMDMSLADEAQLRVLQLLQQQPEWTQRELAEALGVSLGKVNYVLRALIEKGAVKARNFRNSQHKLAYAYLLTPEGVSHKAVLTQRFLHRKVAEYAALNAEIERLKREVFAAAE